MNRSNGMKKESEMSLWYDHLTRSSNISEYILWVDAKVGERYRTLGSCITTLSLKEIIAPSLPTLEKRISQDENIQVMAQAIANAITQSTAIRSSGSTSAAPPPFEKEKTSSKKKGTEEPAQTSTYRSREIRNDNDNESEESEAQLPDEENEAGDSDEMLSTESEEEQDDLDEIDEKDVPDEVKLLRYNVLFKDYIDRRQLRKEELRSLYTFIKSTLSTAMKEKIKLNKDYQAAVKEKNGFKYWCVIYQECRGGDSTQTSAQRKDEVLRQYYNAYQRLEQEVDPYFDYFLELLKKFKIVGLEKPPVEERIARFLSSLNREKFRDLHTALNNDKTIITRFTTLSEAFQYACNFRSVAKPADVKTVFNSSRIRQKDSALVEIHSVEQFSAYNNPNLVILDSGAQLSIFFNKNALVELHQVDPIFIGGINSTEKSVVCDQAGYLPNLKNILIYYNPEVKKNILKFSEMNEKICNQLDAKAKAIHLRR